MAVTPSGMAMDVRRLQDSKALDAIWVTPSGNTTVPALSGGQEITVVFEPSYNNPSSLE
jgi:hypothetical protein